jgi:hypothetical protein
MRDLPNIDKSAFRRGEYVGYSSGIWRIKRDGPVWNATKRDAPFSILSASTLRELSEELAAWETRAA